MAAGLPAGETDTPARARPRWTPDRPRAGPGPPRQASGALQGPREAEKGSLSVEAVGRLRAVVGLMLQQPRRLLSHCTPPRVPSDPRKRALILSCRARLSLRLHLPRIRRATAFRALQQPTTSSPPTAAHGARLQSILRWCALILSCRARLSLRLHPLLGHSRGLLPHHLTLARPSPERLARSGLPPSLPHGSTLFMVHSRYCC